MLAHGDAYLLWHTIHGAMLTGLVPGYPLKSPYKILTAPRMS